MGISVKQCGFLSNNGDFCQTMRLSVKQWGFLSNNEAFCQTMWISVKQWGFLPNNEDFCQTMRLNMWRWDFIDQRNGQNVRIDMKTWLLCWVYVILAKINSLQNRFILRNRLEWAIFWISSPIIDDITLSAN